MYGEMRESVIQVQIWIMTISYMVKYDLVLEIQIWIMNLHKLNMYSMNVTQTTICQH